ncbi:hypothetical protein TNCV_3237281 [Trichonephila clavipes]|nr:hypothetical protein TNCV_3237281 [Trichonephila clavipes]
MLAVFLDVFRSLQLTASDDQPGKENMQYKHRHSGHVLCFPTSLGLAGSLIHVRLSYGKGMIMYASSSSVNPTPLAPADTPRDVHPNGEYRNMFGQRVSSL